MPQNCSNFCNNNNNDEINNNKNIIIEIFHLD